MSNDVCEELIVEIFSWLPAKSLLRFRTVSRSLRARIGRPDFIRLHTLRSPKKLTIIHRAEKYKRKYKRMYTMHSEEQLSSYAGITPVEYPFGHFTELCGSSNGILCVYQYESGDGAFHMWNPSIRRKATVHELPSWSRSVACGFWFDPVINDYKILRSSKEDGTFIYTMTTRTWRTVTPLFYLINGSGCLFDGALHWAVGGHLGLCYVMTFDLSCEVLSTIKFHEPSWCNIQVTIIKGCLAVVSSDYDGTRIWVRNTASGSWSLAFKLTKDEIAYGGGLLAFENGLLVSNDWNGIVVYNPATEVGSRLKRLTHSHGVVGMAMCIETLELLDIGTACGRDSGPLPKPSFYTTTPIVNLVNTNPFWVLGSIRDEERFNQGSFEAVNAEFERRNNVYDFEDFEDVESEDD